MNTPRELAPALHEELDVERQAARRLEPRGHGARVDDRAGLVVGRAPAVEAPAALDGLEGGALPQLPPSRRLDVEWA